MNVVGLDLSLTGTGIATPTGEVTLTTKARGVPRLIELRNRIIDYVTPYEAGEVVVVLEGYSMGGQRGSAGVGQMLGELGGVTRVALHEAGVPYIEVSPSSLKKYACGKGNANKEEVLVAAVRRLGYGGADNNEADAMWLRAMGCDALGTPLAVMPTAHRVALDAVQWPDVAAVTLQTTATGALS